MIVGVNVSQLFSLVLSWKNVCKMVAVVAVAISRQRNIGYKAKQVKYSGTTPLQFPPSFPSLAFIHTSLGWALTRLQASGLEEFIMRQERGRTASTLYTHRQASLMVSCYTTLVSPLRLCIGPAGEAGLSTGT